LNLHSEILAQMVPRSKGFSPGEDTSTGCSQQRGRGRLLELADSHTWAKLLLRCDSDSSTHTQLHMSAESTSLGGGRSRWGIQAETSSGSEVNSHELLGESANWKWGGLRKKYRGPLGSFPSQAKVKPLSNCRNRWALVSTL
jgi:hypothetical protein